MLLVGSWELITRMDGTSMIPYGSFGGSIHDPCIYRTPGSYKVKDTL